MWFLWMLVQHFNDLKLYIWFLLSSVPIHFFVVTNSESSPLVDRVMEQVGVGIETWDRWSKRILAKANNSAYWLLLQVNYTSNCNFDFSILSFDKIIEETQVLRPTSQALVYQNLLFEEDLRNMRVNLLFLKYTRHELIMQGALGSKF